MFAKGRKSARSFVGRSLSEGFRSTIRFTALFMISLIMYLIYQTFQLSSSTRSSSCLMGHNGLFQSKFFSESRYFLSQDEMAIGRIERMQSVINL